MKYKLRTIINKIEICIVALYNILSNNKERERNADMAGSSVPPNIKQTVALKLFFFSHPYNQTHCSLFKLFSCDDHSRNS